MPPSCPKPEEQCQTSAWPGRQARLAGADPCPRLPLALHQGPPPSQSGWWQAPVLPGCWAPQLGSLTHPGFLADLEDPPGHGLPALASTRLGGLQPGQEAPQVVLRPGGTSCHTGSDLQSSHCTLGEAFEDLDWETERGLEAVACDTEGFVPPKVMVRPHTAVAGCSAVGRGVSGGLLLPTGSEAARALSGPPVVPSSSPLKCPKLSTSPPSSAGTTPPSFPSST